MKHFIITTLVVALAFCANAQLKTSSHEVATPELAKEREILKTKIVANYLGMKNSLVHSDSKQTAEFSKELVNALTVFKFKKLSLEEMNAATTTRKSIKELAQHMAESTSINDQRKDMEQLSVQFWTIVDKVKPEKTILYQQKCPMMGTTWLSDSKTIENPYYPKNMLTCGAVIAEK